MKTSLSRLALAAATLAILSPASLPAGAVPAADDTYYPLAKGSKWTYTTDYADDTVLVHEVTGTEKVGEVECFVVEHKTVGPTLGTRMMRKEWVAAVEEAKRPETRARRIAQAVDAARARAV